MFSVRAVYGQVRKLYNNLENKTYNPLGAYAEKDKQKVVFYNKRIEIL